jgi:hypothetical protein
VAWRLGAVLQAFLHVAVPFKSVHNAETSKEREDFMFSRQAESAGCDKRVQGAAFKCLG